ncbi:MAG: AAA family ATPase [Acidimicrobiia bacterium]
METVNLNLEPTLLGAAWRYKWLVLATTTVATVLAFWYSSTNESWTATSTLAVQDPRSSIVFEVKNQLSPERYVADQVEIAKSRTVADRALAQLATYDPPIVIDVNEMLGNIKVSIATATDLLQISYSNADAETAIAAANELASAYQAVSSEGAQGTFEDALAQLDASISERTVELNQVGGLLAELRKPDPNQVDIENQLQAALDAVLTFEKPPATSDQAVIDEANAQLDELKGRVDILNIALGTFKDPDQLATLQAQQDAIRGRLGALQERRDQLEVDAELASTIVVFTSPAESADPSSPVALLVLGILGGAILGAIVAQSLARRSRGFHARSEPQSILQTGLIADVPVFGNEKLTTSLPTTEAPQSAAAEAFRFVATGIELRQHSATDNPFKSVVVASATLADGKTTVTANTAFAAARSGRRIALVDADFVNPALTRMLVPDGTDGPGLTDVVAGETSLAEVGIDITGAPGGSITLFRRGTHGTRIPEFFASTQAANLIHEIEQEYDLVLIDAPPLLRLAHSGTVVRLADRVMIVVAHRSDISVAEELQRYLSIVGVPVLGYVYNFAPLRREMLGRSGSNGRDETAA